MNAKPETCTLDALTLEWERVELLARFLSDSRAGHTIPQEKLDHLQSLQQQIDVCRKQTNPWNDLVPVRLSPLEQDILACIIAPEAIPRIAWLFQSLQPGVPQPYPTLALLQELLALSPTESSQLYTVLSEDYPLRMHRLVDLQGSELSQPVQPSPRVISILLQRPHLMSNLPGTVRIRNSVSWADLILPQERKTILKEFLFWIQHKQIVVQEWGGSDCGGPIGLFSGPSGTGKTLAAVVLANELGWPLYRVDLGCLVSKYIGETEKNLNRLFDAAHEQKLVLQFDEADSLFSKRGEVKEARDRYANMEVSHLLARIESHQGPVILTTNLRKHLDTAFVRRFQVVVDFPRPDKTARAQLWKCHLPAGAPLLPEIDPAFLGEAVNLTGGHIRNAALYASYISAGYGQKIGYKQISLAVWRELNKEGREVSQSDLGPLAEYLVLDGLC
ncbi:ATPase [candidate division LCP-89 bacterium B3_LCP]|uniref:ATPase n=1 Tax=candidate division LCP-89 bacterium B3_LCP TaxID=2012998 RepID=A0A532UUA6_UNCL8|nr:MAG: ATPase [candidate division LCP-89 bacterium B3_LCP]